jgi:L-alanine-DL-glutamate epimerase-like enolase superfamily enzyme
VSAVQDADATLYDVPTERHEADGTLAWDHTTVLLVSVRGRDGAEGVGLSYTGPGADQVVRNQLLPAIGGIDDDDIGACWSAMVASVRNVGRPGLAAAAISAVDIALWDLRGKRRGEPVFRLLPTHRTSVPIYGSGGFTSLSVDDLVAQMMGWVDDGIPRVKMKIGLGVEEDIERILAVREAIGTTPDLLIDANGRYSAKQAIALAQQVADASTYFEEPVSSDAVGDLAMIRQAIPQDVAAGEYGYDPWYFWNLLRSDAVDVLQADATRCLGITGFVLAGGAAYSAQVRFSAHTAPCVHAHAGCGVPQLSHIEYFHDHVRVERLLFDGIVQPSGGELAPDPGRPGLGVSLRAEAERYRRRPE